MSKLIFILMNKNDFMNSTYKCNCWTWEHFNCREL